MVVTITVVEHIRLHELICHIAELNCFACNN